MNNKSKLLLLLSMAIFGTLAPFVRNIPVASGELALYRAIIASVIIILFFIVSKTRPQLSNIKKEIPLLILSGAGLGVNWILLFEAYKYTTVSVATLSYYFAPVIVMAVCPVLFKERFTRKQIICFVMSTIGIVLITGIGDMSSGASHMKGIAFALGAAVLYASVVLLNKFIKNVDGILRTLLQFLSATLVLLPYVMLTSGFTLGDVDAAGWLNLMIVGVVHTGLTYCMYFNALRHVSGQQAAILSYVDPLVAVFISVTVLGEAITVTQIAGGMLILGFTLWNELPQKR